jgi:preprotein translocase subunit SecF
MIQKETVVVLLLVFVIGLNSNFALAMLIGITSYIVVSFKLVSNAFKTVKKWFSGEKSE